MLMIADADDGADDNDDDGDGDDDAVLSRNRAPAMPEMMTMPNQMSLSQRCLKVFYSKMSVSRLWKSSITRHLKAASRPLATEASTFASKSRRAVTVLVWRCKYAAP